MKKIIIIAITLFTISKVYASDVYVNNNSVSIPIEKYNYLLQFYPKNKIDTFTQDQYDKIKNAQLKLISKEEKYFTTTNHIDKNGNTILSVTNELSKSKYEEYNSIATASICEGDELCHETNSKLILGYIVCNDKAVSYYENECGFYIDVTWGKMPVTRSYDVFGLRWSDNFTLENYQGQQGGHVNSYLTSTQYSQGGTNSKTSSNGLGISMNLYDDATTLTLNAEASGRLDIRFGFSVYMTYQHATSNLTLANSKSYSISPSGFGEVLYYSNSTIRNKYDNTQGIKKENIYYA